MRWRARGAFLPLASRRLTLPKPTAMRLSPLPKNMVGAKTFADVIELQAAFARKQFDALGSHVKEIQELSQKACCRYDKAGQSARVDKAFGEIKAA